MRRLSFRKFVEATDIFGFESEKPRGNSDDNFHEKPINQFDIELMIEYLSKRSMPSGLKPQSKFTDEIQWGTEPGAVKLHIDTGYTFAIKRLNNDLRGEPRWVTKKAFQLNRHGYGGYEDSVAQEIFEHILKCYREELDAPQKDYDGLESLVIHIANKMRRVAKDIFMYSGIKKITDNHYVISFNLRGSGVEAPDQSRVEQNQTQISYDKESGTIRVTNYNIESPTGGAHKWKIMPIDIDAYFFPTQSKEEISEAIAVELKYY
jgi:hypothetical protein